MIIRYSGHLSIPVFGYLIGAWNYHVQNGGRIVQIKLALQDLTFILYIQKYMLCLWNITSGMHVPHECSILGLKGHLESDVRQSRFSSN